MVVVAHTFNELQWTQWKLNQSIRFDERKYTDSFIWEYDDHSSLILSFLEFINDLVSFEHFTSKSEITGKYRE